MKTDPSTRPKRGRPLSFDREAALDQAMLLFWQYGYEGTSLSQLTAAMGIAPPSLYAAFGDKKQLFLEAVARYTAGPITAESIFESSATARDATWKLLERAATGFTGAGTPAGCLLLSAATACSPAAADVQAALAEIRQHFEAQLRARIEDDIGAGVLPRETDAEALALLYTAVVQGMSAQARDGASRTKLLALANAAMNAWPSSAGKESG